MVDNMAWSIAPYIAHVDLVAILQASHKRVKRGADNHEPKQLQQWLSSVQLSES